MFGTRDGIFLSFSLATVFLSSRNASQFVGEEH